MLLARLKKTLRMSSIRKAAIGDAALNILSTAIPLCLLQLVILPAMADDLSSTEYAVVLTMVSILNLFPGTFGMALNNIRLIYHSKYKELGISGDFPLLAGFVALAGGVFTTLFGFAYHVSGVLHFTFLAVTGMLWGIREYFSVDFRIHLNYRAVLISNIWSGAGHLIGFILFELTGYWELVYLVGQVTSMCFVIRNSRIYREKISTTPMMKKVSAEYFELVGSNLLSRSLSYADRLLLYPILGGTAVTIYYISSLAGKILSTAITPINSVVLSYLSRRKDRPVAEFWRSMGLCSVLCATVFLIIQFAGKPVLGLLYPNYVDQAVDYLWMASLGSLIYVLSSVAVPFTLRYYAMKWQVFFDAISLVLYCLLSFFLSSTWGLMGFCIANVASNLIKLVALVCLFHFIEPDSESRL